MQKTCVKCGKEFDALHYQKRLCNECAKKNQKINSIKMAKLRAERKRKTLSHKKTIVCVKCGKTFERIKVNLCGAERKVCDLCLYKWRRNYENNWRKKGRK